MALQPWVQAKFHPRPDALPAAIADNASMREPDVVRVRGLCKAYGNRTVVDRLDLDVWSGEIVGLIGATAPARPPPWSASRAYAGPTRGRCASSASTPLPRPTSSDPKSAASSKARPCPIDSGLAKLYACLLGGTPGT